MHLREILIKLTDPQPHGGIRLKDEWAKPERIP
jgi:hypothetical protein